ncbi:glycoside hydrolase [Ectothiorhodospiraceae bacterium BW-2]|nr:glycoside hydrolase [Ectothiorhodospiraceae bacterium BW-2]
MLVKNYSKTGKRCRVTFKLHHAVEANKVRLCGDFNQWDKIGIPLRRLKDGGFSTTISLDTDREYRFRYWIDDERWENDWEADGYVANEFGSDDSLLKL